MLHRLLPFLLASCHSKAPVSFQADYLLREDYRALTEANGWGLMVGINDYSAFDDATGSAPGTSDLLGARNDAILWWRTARVLGIPAERLTVLTSPPLTPAELGPGAEDSTLGEATGDSIRQASEALAESLADDPEAIGLLTWSGHGAWRDGAQLCPSDAGADLSGCFPPADLRAPFESRGAADNLTVLLDACYAGNITDGAGRGHRTLTPQAVGARQPGELAIGARVLAATEPGQLSYESLLGGHIHGAFSWSLATAAQQWQAVEEDGSNRLTVSHGELRDHTQRLLDALDFDQTVTLAGPEGIEELAFLHVGTEAHDGETVDEPDGERSGNELDPGNNSGIVYKFKNGTQNLIFAIVTGSQSLDYEVRYEDSEDSCPDDFTGTCPADSACWGWGAVASDVGSDLTFRCRNVTINGDPAVEYESCQGQSFAGDRAIIANASCEMEPTLAVVTNGAPFQSVTPPETIDDLDAVGVALDISSAPGVAPYPYLVAQDSSGDIVWFSTQSTAISTTDPGPPGTVFESVPTLEVLNNIQFQFHLEDTSTYPNPATWQAVDSL